MVPVMHKNLFDEIKPRPYVGLDGIKLSYGAGGSNGSFALSIDSLRIEGGKIHCIYGTNGCGKTSLLKLLARVIPLREGRVKWEGLKSPVPGQDYILVTQAGPWPHWSVWRNICEPQIERGGVYREKAEEKTRAVISLLGLEGLEGRYAHQLSTGQQQRTVLARAFVLSPKILFLDEVMSGQSEYWAERIAAILRSFADLGGMVVMVSHDPEWVMVNADRVTHIVSTLGDAVSSTHFFCGYDGDSKCWSGFREERLRLLMDEKG